MTVQPLQPERYAEAAAVLVRAFEHDPIYGYILPDPQRRLTQMHWIIERAIRQLAPYGASYITENGEGAALWLPPKPRPRIPSFPWFSGLATLGLGASYRGLQVYIDMLRREHAETKSPHWVLEIIGVDPAHQGRGAATALLQPALDIAESDNVPCHVITHNPKSIPFYQSHGFQILSQGQVTKQKHFVCSLRRQSQ